LFAAASPIDDELPEAELPDVPEAPDVSELDAGDGATLEVEFSPVGLILPASLAGVLPAAFSLFAAASPIDDELPEAELPDVPEAPDVSELDAGGGATLEVEFSPVGLIAPALLAGVLPEASGAVEDCA
jgi:hypothetical protein